MQSRFTLSALGVLAVINVRLQLCRLQGSWYSDRLRILPRCCSTLHLCAAQPLVASYLSMNSRSRPAPSEAALQAYLLGTVDFRACLALQQRLVYEAGERTDGQITLLICEHTPTITVGRGGSRWDIRLTDQELTSRQVPVVWVGRGGGCLAHGPGQVAIYPIVPLSQRGLTVGEYLCRMQAALVATLQDVGIRPQMRAEQFDLWGRTGQLATVAAAVRNWTTYHGAFINVCPAMHLFRHVRTNSGPAATMSSLVADSQKPIKMTSVRSSIVRHVAVSLGCERLHIHSGHPFLLQQSKVLRESARAS